MNRKPFKKDFELVIQVLIFLYDEIQVVSILYKLVRKKFKQVLQILKFSNVCNNLWLASYTRTLQNSYFEIILSNKNNSKKVIY